MIFAAGRGTRLQPITDDMPKALVPVGGKAMLVHVIERLMHAGVDYFVINVHHHPDKIRRFVDKLNYPGATFRISDESDRLLDTGGGLSKASRLLEGDQAIFLHNADVLSGIDPGHMWEYHHRRQAMVTLAVSQRHSSRYFLWHNSELAGWENKKSGERIMVKDVPEKDVSPLAFSGIHIISPEVLGLLPEAGCFSVRDVYLRLAAAHKVVAYEHSPGGWIDIGTPEKLRKAEGMIGNQIPGTE